MKVADLLKKADPVLSSEICSERLVAYDAMNGKILFDTKRNTKAHIEKFFNGTVVSLWPDALSNKRGESCIRLVLKCYVTHGSWEGEWDEDVDEESLKGETK